MKRLARLSWLAPVIVVMLGTVPASAGQLTLGWVDNSTNESGFMVDRKTGTAGTFAQVAAVGANVVTYTDGTVTPGTLYCYEVRSYNAGGVSAASNEACGLGATFRDVSSSYWAWRYVEALAALGVTSGCGAGGYCPEGLITRAQLAVFLLKARHGSGYVPPAPSGAEFGDVPASHWAAAWIEELVAEGITAGCGAGNYCPGNVVTRAEMAVFLLRAKYGAGYRPPTATGAVFRDVPRTHWAADWIEQLFFQGVAAGCAPATYCPGSAVVRAQMAVFLVRALDLPIPF